VADLERKTRRRGRLAGGRAALSRLDDEALLGELLARPEPFAGGAPRAAGLGLPGLGLAGLGLAGLARTPVSRWPSELGLDAGQRRRLAAALELGRRAWGDGGPSLGRPADVFAWCVELRFARRERFVAFYLDARHRVRRRRLISVGTLTASLVHPREVLAPAVRHRAAALVAVHNHPSGDPEPSPEDVSLTERLRAASELLGVELLDHVIVAREGFVSLREHGVL
jgi:DNA repair protein RadC